MIKVASASQLICEYAAPAHFPGPPLHVHPGFDETFMLLDGRLEVAVRDAHVDLRAADQLLVDQEAVLLLHPPVAAGRGQLEVAELAARRGADGGGRADDYAVRVYAVATGKLFQSFEGHTGPVCGLAFAPDNRALLSVAADDTLRLWRLTGAPL